jgi:shikimate dehydrogenase
VRALGIRGVNITIPHKERVMDFLDEIDETARALGAVNTIENKGGRLLGHNTDAGGFVSSLVDETGVELRGLTALVVGAGGAARAVVYGLASRGAARIIVANRTVERAEALCADLAAACPGVELEAVSLDAEEMKRLLGQTRVLVNATSLGMKGRGELDLPLERLGKDAVVSDIVYTPMETGLLRRARALGLGLHHGLGMLVGQGALSFEIWTGCKAPVDVMREAALRALGQGPG